MASVHSIACLAQHVRLNFVLLEDSFAARVEFSRCFKGRNLLVDLMISTFELLFNWVSHFDDSTYLHLP